MPKAKRASGAKPHKAAAKKPPRAQSPRGHSQHGKPSQQAKKKAAGKARKGREQIAKADRAGGALSHFARVKLDDGIEDGKVDRVTTGLAGLDNMLQGGIPRESIILLSGACGTGKSTFAMQFLYYGAKYCNEPGVYVTLEEDPKKLVDNMSLFGWDLQKLIDEKKLIIIKPEVYKFDSIKQIIGDAIDRIGAKRLVVDSYSVLLTYFNDPYEIRNGLVQLDREIKKMGATALVISDIKDNSEIFSTTGVEEFIVDGVIVLYLIKSPAHPYESKRAISVRKMRATHHPLNLYTFDIGQRGVYVAGEGLKSGQDLAPKAGRKGHARKAPHHQAARKSASKPSSMVEISALKSRGGHTWKWRHL